MATCEKCGRLHCERVRYPDEPALVQLCDEVARRREVYAILAAHPCGIVRGEEHAAVHALAEAFGRRDAEIEKLRAALETEAAASAGYSAERDVLKADRDEWRKAFTDLGFQQTQSARVIDSLRAEVKAGRDENAALVHACGGILGAEKMRADIARLESEKAAMGAELNEARQAVRNLDAERGVLRGAIEPIKQRMQEAIDRAAAMGAALVPFAQLIEDHETLPDGAWCEHMVRVGAVRACQPHALESAAAVLREAGATADRHRQYPRVLGKPCDCPLCAAVAAWRKGAGDAA